MRSTICQNHTNIFNWESNQKTPAHIQLKEVEFFFIKRYKGNKTNRSMINNNNNTYELAASMKHFSM